MPICKKQLHRLIMLVARLKQNLYPNCSSFVNELRKCDLYENKNVLCSPKTIQRDIQTLISEFGAPIQFDKSKNGYYLEDKSWDFLFPMISEEEISAELLVALKVLENTYPCSTNISAIIDKIIATQNLQNSGNSIFDSLIVYDSKQGNVKPDIFTKVITAWYNRNCLQLEIDKQTNIFEPHVLACVDNEWFVCGLQNGNENTLSLSSINEVLILNERFQTSRRILKQVKSSFQKNLKYPSTYSPLI